jgi:hypothetical protein
MTTSMTIPKAMPIGVPLPKKKPPRRKAAMETVAMAKIRINMCESSEMWCVTGGEDAMEPASLDNFLSKQKKM